MGKVPDPNNPTRTIVLVFPFEKFGRGYDIEERVEISKKNFERITRLIPFNRPANSGIEIGFSAMDGKRKKAIPDHILRFVQNTEIVKEMIGAGVQVSFESE